MIEMRGTALEELSGAEGAEVVEGRESERRTS
jgi:hypothetical protein